MDKSVRNSIQNVIHVNNPDKKQDGDKIHKNLFYFVANAQLFDSSESNVISPMSNMAINIAAALHIFIQIIGHAN